MVSYALGTVGAVALWACLLSSLAAVGCLVFGHVRRSPAVKRAGFTLVFVSAAAILISCLVIVHGFFAHNVAIAYVAQNYPTDTGDGLFWLFQLAGLWASRAGSLLLWGFLIAAFAAWVAWRRRTQADDLTTVALVITEIVLVLFVMTMLFSTSNNPFVPTSASLIDENGNLTGQAASWGMNVLLEHWAMALHPPTLFIGYAGMTIPFAYGIAALAINDPSHRWIDLCQRIALFSFIFLTIGIGLGAVWAYVVLGWGGYWGWDPVENASLLSWLTSVAMLHSFNVYRKRDMMRGWALLAATLTFCFVVLGTFITRSGLVQSVHAFSEDQVSTVIFLVIMGAAMLALLVGWIARRSTFMSGDDIESVISKNGSFYLTSLIMVFSAVLLAYLTISSALPGWLPAGGVTVGSGAYDSVSRPLGVVFCALAAVCPFLAWRKTDGAEFAKNVRIPAIAGAVLFVLLMVLWVTRLYPAYTALLAGGGTPADDLAAMGPSWYYNGLAIIGLLVAALLTANSAYLVVRGVRSRMTNKSENAGQAIVRLFAKAPAQAGGYLTHFGLGIVLVGLIASSMYVTEHTFMLAENETSTMQLGSYTLEYRGDSNAYDQSNNIVYTARIGVTRDGADLGEMQPTVALTASSGYGQTKLQAETRSSLFEDLFVAFQGYTSDGSVVINARVNPLIWMVWVGFGIMTVGIIACTLPKRGGALQVVDSATTPQPVKFVAGQSKVKASAASAGKASKPAAGAAGGSGASGANKPAKAKKARPRKSR